MTQIEALLGFLGEAVTPVELLGYALSLTAFGAYNYFRLYDI